MRRIVALAVVLLMVLAAPVEAGRRAKNRVDRIKGNAYVMSHQQLGPSGETRCKGVIAYARAVNSRGHQLFRFNQRANWCYRGGKFRRHTPNWITWASVGNQFWNLWDFDKVTDVVKGSGKGYRYRRTHARFEACISKWGCFMDFRVWVSMTVRTDGTWTWDRGGT